MRLLNLTSWQSKSYSLAPYSDLFCRGSDKGTPLKVVEVGDVDVDDIVLMGSSILGSPRLQISSSRADFKSLKARYRLEGSYDVRLGDSYANGCIWRGESEEAWVSRVKKKEVKVLSKCSNSLLLWEIFSTHHIPTFRLLPPHRELSCPRCHSHLSRRLASHH